MPALSQSPRSRHLRCQGRGRTQTRPAGCRRSRRHHQVRALLQPAVLIVRRLREASRQRRLDPAARLRICRSHTWTANSRTRTRSTVIAPATRQSHRVAVPLPSVAQLLLTPFTRAVYSIGSRVDSTANSMGKFHVNSYLAFVIWLLPGSVDGLAAG